MAAETISEPKTSKNRIFPFSRIEHNGELSPLSSASVINEVLPGALEKQYEEDEQRNGVDEEAVAIPDMSINDYEFTYKDKELFTQQFKVMTNDKKWKLSTGKYVEDVLYDLGVKCKYHNLIHSFIINPSDNFVQTGFDPKKISEIINKEYGNKMPDIDKNLLAYINSFPKGDETSESNTNCVRNNNTSSNGCIPDY
nr:8820_t:CDS:2 [Entrophospora candida]